MAGLLTDYLAECAGRKFAYGTHDCATFVAGWLDRATGLDGLSAWLGQYHDELSCAAFIAAGGGMVPIADAFISSRYGMARTMTPRAGNPLVVDYRGNRAMAIRVSERDVAMMMSADRLIVTPRVTVIAEWGDA